MRWPLAQTISARRLCARTSRRTRSAGYESRWRTHLRTSRALRTFSQSIGGIAEQDADAPLGGQGGVHLADGGEEQRGVVIVQGRAPIHCVKPRPLERR